MHSGENDLQAARRELSEELALEVTEVGPAELERCDPGSQFLIAFVSVSAVGHPRLIEHSEFRWATVDQLEKLEMAPADRVYVTWLKQRGIA